MISWGEVVVYLVYLIIFEMNDCEITDLKR